MRVILAGGGTGGHVIPALAIAQELKSQFAAEVIFIGTSRGIETRLVPQAGFELRLVEVGPLNRVSFARRLRTVSDLPRAILASRRILRAFRPDVAIGVGGYASGPAMLAAILRGVPTIAFEPNLMPGFANRRVARWVTAAAVQFEESCRWFGGGKCHVTGVPVRAAFFQVPPRGEAEGPSLLVFGGSQGAHAINRAICEALPELRRRVPELAITHQSGEREFETVRSAYAAQGVEADVRPYIEDMARAYDRADLLVCRSGASTVAEVAAAGRAAIFIPFPRAADDHQRRNAEALASKDAAVVLPESELTPARLAETIAGLFADRARLRQMSAAARALSRPDAARAIAQLAKNITANRRGR
ncbi:MAG TPA: undecaprenyldiphospho-muramoylpentapeptide beta-N-acetylglucosaminyltransferase [Terriglobales bacterium]|nr:undecaprenyldiphospho-muramoylpentapeptide beta-N-acetylglucosaminyltransferase [Terriglobales bacterium]